MDLIEGEYNGLATPVLDELRTQTRELHRSFIEKYGNYEVSLKKIARLDEDYYNVMSLQDHKGREAPFYTKRPFHPRIRSIKFQISMMLLPCLCMNVIILTWLTLRN
jgi:ribosome biogenesis protein Nip4